MSSPFSPSDKEEKVSQSSSPTQDKGDKQESFQQEAQGGLFVQKPLVLRCWGTREVMPALGTSAWDSPTFNRQNLRSLKLEEVAIIRSPRTQQSTYCLKTMESVL